jgi:hypothetical protein
MQQRLDRGRVGDRAAVWSQPWFPVERGTGRTQVPAAWREQVGAPPAADTAGHASQPSRPIALAEPEGKPHGRQLLAGPRYESVYAPGVVGVVAGSTAFALTPLVLGRR